MTRLKEFDLAKGIGIILVVLGHFFPEGAPSWYAHMRQVIYSFHMPLFLFVSGFVYMHTRRDIPYGAFLLKKARRIAVPYFLVSFLFIAVKLLPQALSIYVKNPVTSDSFLKVFYYPEAAISFWYLWVLWWFYMIIPLLKTRKSRLVMAAVSIVAAWIPLDLPDVFCLPKLHEMFRYLMIGVVAYDWKEYMGWIRKIPVIAVAAMFCMLTFLRLSAGIPVAFLLALTGVWAVLGISSGLVRLADKGYMKWLIVVSASSYTIYLFHPMFIAACLAVMKACNFEPASSLSFACVAAVAVGISVAAPVLIRKISERVFSRLRAGTSSAE